MIDQWKEEKEKYIGYLSDFCEYGARNENNYITSLCLRHQIPLMVIKRGQSYHEEYTNSGKLNRLWTVYISRKYLWALFWRPEEKWVVKGDPIYLKVFGRSSDDELFEFPDKDELLYQKPLIFEYKEREELCTAKFLKRFFTLRYGYSFDGGEEK